MKIDSNFIFVDEAVNIAKDLLKPVIRFLNTFGYFFMYDDENFEDEKYHTVFGWSDQNSKKIRAIRIENEDDLDYCNDMTYYMNYKGQKYEIQFYDSPDVCGYNSTYPNYDSSTYVLCYIKRIDNKGDLSAEIIFGFDILTMSIVEVFTLDVCVKKPILKEMGIEIGRNELLDYDLLELEKQLFGIKLKGVLYNV